MTRGHRAVVLVIGAGLAVGLVERPGQVLAQAGYYVTPSFSVWEVYDDNIFFTSSNRQDDFVSRFMPGLKAGFQSEPFTLLGGYSFRSAVYAEHPTLDSPTESQVGSLEVKYRPFQLLTLGFDGAYSRTSIPSELNQPNPALPFIPIQATTGILTTRVASTFYSLMPSIGYTFDPRTRGNATYDYLVFEGGGFSTTTHAATLQLDRDVTRQDVGTLKAYYSHIETGSSGVIAFPAASGSLDSYAVTAGWTHRFTPQWDASVEAGPRYTEGTGVAGTVDAQASATINWRFERGTASLGYSRTELTAAGVGGGLRSDSVFATVAADPTRFLHLSLTPRWVLNTPEASAVSTTGTLTIYTVDATATYQVTRWLRARLNYQYFSEQGSGLNIPHNLVTIGLDFVYPERVY